MVARALANFKGAAEIKVSVLDSGSDKGHPALIERNASYVYQHSDLPTLQRQNNILWRARIVVEASGPHRQRFRINGIRACQSTSKRARLSYVTM